MSVTGKGGALRETDLGAVGRWVAFAACLVVGLLAVFLPGLIMLQAAFARTWSLGLSPENFTLENFDYLIFKHSSAFSSILNTFSYSAVAATFAVLAALAVAYVHLRGLAPVSGLLVLLTVSPVAIPAIVLGVAFYAAFAPPPFRLYGTAALLVMAFIVRFLPIAYMNVSATLRSLNPEMEDAVRILGGGRVAALRHVIVPIIRKGLIGVWLIVFVAATRELSTALFLTGPQTKVMSVLMIDLSEEGNFEVLSALGCLLLFTAWLVVAIGQRVAGRDFMIGRA